MLVMIAMPIGADDGPWEDTVDGVLHINDDWIHQDEIDAWREEVAPLWAISENHRLWREREIHLGECM